jgi:plastocyanin
MVAMKSLQALTLTVLISAMSLAGCLGGGDEAGDLNASFTVTQQTDMTFLFDASNSTGNIVEYQWNFGDGTLITGPDRKIEMEYTISNAQPFVSLIVVAEDGTKQMALKQVTLGSGKNVAPEIHPVETRRWVTPGEDVTIDATGAEDHDGDGFTTEWFFGTFQDPAPPEAALDTGLLAMDESYEETFSGEGVYFIHCHPHPWMVGRIVVEEGAEAPDNATLTIENFAYSNGTDMVIPPGTTVSIVNKDPVAHTATNYFAGAGLTKQETTDKVLRLSGLEAGDYQAAVVFDDKKPGFPTTHTWGVKVSDDAPTIEFDEPVASGGPVTAADDAVVVDFPAALEFGANITAEVGFNQVPVVETVVSFTIEGPTTITGQCASGTCTAIGDLEPGEYSFVFDVSDGGVTDYTISVNQFKYFTKPDFGDPAEGGGHVH